MTGHGFRGLASTALNEIGFRPDVIAAQLAHVEVEENRVRATTPATAKSDACHMQSWADFADAVRQSAHVIPMWRGTALLPRWFSNSEDLVEWQEGDALDAIDRR